MTPIALSGWLWCFSLSSYCEFLTSATLNHKISSPQWCYPLADYQLNFVTSCDIMASLVSHCTICNVQWLWCYSFTKLLTLGDIAMRATHFTKLLTLGDIRSYDYEIQHHDVISLISVKLFGHFCCPRSPLSSIITLAVPAWLFWHSSAAYPSPPRLPSWLPRHPRGQLFCHGVPRCWRPPRPQQPRPGWREWRLLHSDTGWWAELQSHEGGWKLVSVPCGGVVWITTHNVIKLSITSPGVWYCIIFVIKAFL